MPILAVIVLAVMITALIDVILRRDDQVKHMPKFVWLLLVVLLPLIGSVLWFTLGREWSAPREAMSFGDPRRWSKDAGQSPPASRVARDDRSTSEQLSDLEREMQIAELEAQLRQRRSRGGESAGASG